MVIWALKLNQCACGLDVDKYTVRGGGGVQTNRPIPGTKYVCIIFSGRSGISKPRKPRLSHQGDIRKKKKMMMIMVITTMTTTTIMEMTMTMATIV